MTITPDSYDFVDLRVDVDGANVLDERAIWRYRAEEMFLEHLLNNHNEIADEVNELKNDPSLTSTQRYNEAVELAGQYCSLDARLEDTDEPLGIYSVLTTYTNGIDSDTLVHFPTVETRRQHLIEILEAEHNTDYGYYHQYPSPDQYLLDEINRPSPSRAGTVKLFEAGLVGPVGHYSTQKVIT